MGGIEFDIVYEGQVQVMQRQGKALAISQSFQQAAPVIQADPTVLKVLNMERTFKNIFEYNGAPAECLNTDEEMQAKNDAEAQQQQLTNMATIAGPASSAIKNLSLAQQASGASMPGGVGAAMGQ